MKEKIICWLIGHNWKLMTYLRIPNKYTKYYTCERCGARYFEDETLKN